MTRSYVWYDSFEWSYMCVYTPFTDLHIHICRATTDSLLHANIPTRMSTHYLCTYIFIYTYSYIQGKCWFIWYIDSLLCANIHICVYIYVCQHSIHLHICINIYRATADSFGRTDVHHPAHPRCCQCRGICCESAPRTLLQHTATHCNVLQYTATRNLLWVSAPRTAATHCNTLQYTAIHCNEESAVSACASHYCDTLQCTAMHCNALQWGICCGCLQRHTATHCNVLQRGICCECLHLALLQRTTAPHCNTLQLNATRNLPWVPASRTAATHCNEESAVGACASRCNELHHTANGILLWVPASASCHTYEWVKSHIHMRHAADVNLL